MSSLTAMTSARKARATRTRFFYSLILPSALAAYSNVRRHGPTVARHHYPVKTIVRHSVINTSQKSSNINNQRNEKTLSNSDIQHIKLAARLARIGYGNTFPNPAVGCVLVRHQDEDEIIGSGFHPRAGMPHAEVFALLEARNHVEDGVDAARSVMDCLTVTTNDDRQRQKVLDLLKIYKSEDGTNKLFKDCLIGSDVTAYVTLEPCCHVGQTPPCALSLVAAGIKRVVVGFRDPNPKVSGGGIQVLKDSGVDVIVLSSASADGGEIAAADECARLVEFFVKRISPRQEPLGNLDELINGKKRRALRQLAGRQKTAGTIQELEWPRDKTISDEDKKDNDFGERVNLNVRFLEEVDNALWNHELILVRLNNVVHKKKGAKVLSARIADALNAHVAQVLGHTTLLYRPGFVPVLDLDELAMKDEEK